VKTVPAGKPHKSTRESLPHRLRPLVPQIINDEAAALGVCEGIV
jgi:hypothetical protein